MVTVVVAVVVVVTAAGRTQSQSDFRREVSPSLAQGEAAKDF